MKKLLIVVDMINGFINEGNLHDKEIKSIAPKCAEHIERFIAEGQDIVAFCDNHNHDSKEFTAFPSHCLSGSTESELIDELATYRADMDIIAKNSTNGFFAPGFQNYLVKLNDYEEILLVGCCTDICVLQLALSLKAYCNENDYDCKIVVDEAACETFEIPGHNRQEYNEMAKKLMINSGIEVIEVIL